LIGDTLKLRAEISQSGNRTSFVPLEFALRGPCSVLMGFDYSMQRAFNEIEMGEPKKRLYELFGDPWSTEPDFSPAIAYRESDFTPEKLSQCIEFVTWVNGGNWFYCFGIDENGKIVLKADGHS
jgi:hypothetical protein